LNISFELKNVVSIISTSSEFLNLHLSFVVFFFEQDRNKQSIRIVSPLFTYTLKIIINQIYDLKK